MVTKIYDLNGPRLKVERAEHHIRDLEARFGNYVRNNVKRMRPERNQRALKQGRSNTPKSFDKHIPTILGDAIHNLHAALDYTYHIAADANSAAWSDYRKFPFGKDRKSLEASINGHVKQGTTPSQKVIAVILNEIQPYVSGQLGLYALHELDITDKHVVLIPTVSVMHIEKLEFRDASGAKTGGGIEGISIVMDQSKGGNFIDFGAGSGVMHGNPKSAFDILFQEGQPYAGKPILEVLKGLKVATSSAIDLIEGAI